MLYTTTGHKQTQKLGEKFAKEILKLPLQKTAVVLGLKGNLGGGKTTFLQGFAKEDSRTGKTPDLHRSGS